MRCTIAGDMTRIGADSHTSITESRADGSDGFLQDGSPAWTEAGGSRNGPDVLGEVGFDPRIEPLPNAFVYKAMRI